MKWQGTNAVNTEEIDVLVHHSPSPPKIDWMGDEALLGALPEKCPFVSRGSIDRYGFSHALARRCLRRGPEKCFAEWVHGWIWDENPTAETLAVSKLHRNVKIVVATTRHKQILLESGFSNVFAGGLPFAYISGQNSVRYNASLLVMPVHSAEDNLLNAYSLEYLDYLESLKSSFSVVYVCLHKMDYSPEILSELSKRGLNSIVGADPNDANSLLRVRVLLESFETVTTNSIGSHFIYALYSGCKFSFSGPFYERQAAEVEAYAQRHSLSEDFVEKKLLSHSRHYLQRRFPDFFCETPANAIYGDHWVEKAVGIENLLSQNDIVNILGWSLRGKIEGYSMAAIRRFQSHQFDR